jgi:putative Mg2+ transporter-C (MgtC) family protein
MMRDGDQMSSVSGIEMIGRLALAAALGFLVGLQRAISGQPAGERTHALVALGAATFALVAMIAFPGEDPDRVAAGIVTGLGFLGAGAILRRDGEQVQGLTTAAGMWGVGAVGLAIGTGSYALGIAAAALIVVILALEQALHLGRRMTRRKTIENDEDGSS